MYRPYMQRMHNCHILYCIFHSYALQIWSSYRWVADYITVTLHEGFLWLIVGGFDVCFFHYTFTPLCIPVMLLLNLNS
jgi:hypothetical protein